MTAPALQPVTLAGTHVRLEPLSRMHAEALWEVARDPELWRWTSVAIETRAALDDYIAVALADRVAGRALPFVIVAGDTVAGSTRFGNFSAENRRVEIGWTWLGKPWQRTAVNTQTKLLLLQHAFERLDLMRVEFKTDVLNERSRAAILRLGATQEGILRHHMLTYSGRWRDSVYFSILADEWPTVKANLELKLAPPVPGISG